MPVRLRLQTSDAPAPHLDLDPNLSLEDVLEELAEVDGPVALRARGALADATLVEAVVRLHREAADITLLVGSSRIAARLERALPGSGGRWTGTLPSGARLVLAEGDILAVPVAAIVNPSNRWLRLGAGVSGAIARAADPTLQRELTRLAGREGIASGDGVMTAAHGVAGVEALIHVNAVSGEAAVVEQATVRAVELARAAGLASVALPLLGTGTGGLDVPDGVDAMLRALRRMSGADLEIWLVVWSDAVFEVARSRMGDGMG